MTMETDVRVEADANDAAVGEKVSIYPHLDEETRVLMSHDDAARVSALLGDVLVRHPAVVSTLAYSRWLAFQPKRTRTKGMLIVGSNGSGKTTLAELIERIYGKDDAFNQDTVVKVSMTNMINSRMVYGRILEAIDAPVSEHSRAADRELAVTRALRAIGCKILILDEIQDVLFGSEKDQQKCLGAVKYLMNELGIVVIALGTEDAERAFASDPHLDARFRTFYLPTWKADDDLFDLLFNVQAKLPLKGESDFSDPKILKYLVSESKGSLDGIMTLVRDAAVHAIASKEEKVSLNMLQKAREFPSLQFV